MQLPSAGGEEGLVTLHALTELALRLSPRTLSGGGVDIEGGGASADKPPTCRLPPAARGKKSTPSHELEQPLVNIGGVYRPAKSTTCPVLGCGYRTLGRCGGRLDQLPVGP